MVELEMHNDEVANSLTKPVDIREKAKRGRGGRGKGAIGRGRGRGILSYFSQEQQSSFETVGLGRAKTPPRARGRGLYLSARAAQQAQVGSHVPVLDDMWTPPKLPAQFQWTVPTTSNLKETEHAWGVHENQTRRKELLEKVMGDMATLLINTGIKMRGILNELDEM